MPKPFNEADRARIRGRLLSAGQSIINRGGLRTLTVAQVADEAGIAKGSFYAFFPSREDFVLSVFEVWEAEFRTELLTHLATPGRSVRDRWEAFFRGTFALLDREPGLAAMNSREVALLMERLPPERLAAHQEADRLTFEQALGSLIATGVLAPADAPAFPGVVMALFAAVVFRDQFPPGSWGPAAELTAQALALRFSTHQEELHE
jgi:AcrR family transcriptional regulator